MASVEHVEKALERLMPAALGAEAARAIEETIETLAAGRTPLAESQARPAVAARDAGDRRTDFRRGLGAAAAIAAGGIAALWWWPDQPQQVAPLARTAETAPEMELVREVNRVESAIDEGTLADENGGVHRVLRYRVVGESLVRDGSTGSLVKVVEPREEIVLLPVTAF